MCATNTLISEVEKNQTLVRVNDVLWYIDGANFQQWIVTDVFDGGFEAKDDYETRIYFFNELQLGWRFSDKTKQQKVICTLAQVRIDIKSFKMTGSLPTNTKSIQELKEMEFQLSTEAYQLRNNTTSTKNVEVYKNNRKYNSEIQTGLKYWDRRYMDSYTIESMELVEGGDVDVSMAYSKGQTRTESGDFILYHMDAKQHQLSRI